MSRPRPKTQSYPLGLLSGFHAHLFSGHIVTCLQFEAHQPNSPMKGLAQLLWAAASLQTQLQTLKPPQLFKTCSLLSIGNQPENVPLRSQLKKATGLASAEYALSSLSTGSMSSPHCLHQARVCTTHSISPATCKNQPFPTIHMVTIRVTMFLSVATPPGHKPLAQVGPISPFPGTIIQELKETVLCIG